MADAMVISKTVDCPYCIAKAGEDCWSQERSEHGGFRRMYGTAHSARAVPAPACPTCAAGEGECCLNANGEPYRDEIQEATIVAAFMHLERQRLARTGFLGNSPEIAT